MIGKKLGKYLIEAEIGRGGMGVVYRAQQTSLERVVALKVLAPNLIGDPDSVARFRREAKAIARLNHPGIVQVIDIEEESGVLYLVMEYVEGEALDQQLSRMALAVPRTVRLVADIADALHFAHEKGVVHRDVKPANVLVTKAGRVKVADFGLAHFLDLTGGQTKTGLLVGSPSYMSPEQIQGQRVDRRTDVYSLGVVLFRMLTGRVPFVAETSTALLFKHVQEAPPDPLELNPALDARVRDIVLYALNKRPDDRFPTMAAFRAALLGALGEAVEEDESLSMATGVLLDDDREAALRKPPPPAAVSAVPPTVDVSMPTAILTTRSRPKPEAPAPGSIEPPTAGYPEARSASLPGPSPTPTPPPAEPGTPRWIIALPLVLLAGLALALVYRFRPTSTVASPTPAPRATAAPAPSPAPVVSPTSVPATPPPKPEATASPRRAESPTAVPKPKKTATAVVAQVAPTPEPTAIPELTGTKPFCLMVPTKTAFEQKRVKDIPKGFSPDAGAMPIAPRPDAARIQLVADLFPQNPLDGQRFTFKVSLENGGDLDLAIASVEESIPTGERPFAPVTSVKAPPRVTVSEAAPVYAFSGVLEPRSNFQKTIRVTDQRGDSWTRSFYIRPCP